MVEMKTSVDSNSANKSDMYLNGILEILFMISIWVSIVHPAALFASLVIAGAAIAVNVKLSKYNSKG